MIYGYDEQGYVRAIWQEPPADPQGLALLEVDGPEAPATGYWRVSGGALVELPSSPESFEVRKGRIQARRAARAAQAPRLSQAPDTPQ
jgi:hypothetical protein